MQPTLTEARMNTSKAALWTEADVAGATNVRGITIAYWVATSLFALQMGFTAYAQLRLPQVAEAFAHRVR